LDYALLVGDDDIGEVIRDENEAAGSIDESRMIFGSVAGRLQWGDAFPE
jgi:hypothetical protein